MFPKISVDPGRGKPPIELQKSFDTDLETNNKTVVDAINEINRKIGYDTYSNWTTNNPVLKKGEVAIATIETNSDGIQNSPAVVVKVGDGTSAYNSLKFVSGLAADVYSWAKQSTKPTYSASEISGLSDFISEEIEDTNTTYQVVKVDDYNYKLQSKDLNGDWADVNGGTITIPAYDDTEVKADITAIETAVDGKADKATTIDGYGITDAYTKSEIDSVIEAKADSSTTLAGYGITDSYTKSEVDSSINSINTTLSSKADKATTIDGYGITDAYTKTEVDSKIGEIGTALDQIIALENSYIGGGSA